MKVPPDRVSELAGIERPLYQRILGDAWYRLPAPLRAMHQYTGSRFAAGRADVSRGRNPLARLIAWVMGFPGTGRQVPVEVEFSVVDGGERWTRDFGGRTFTSFQWPGCGRSEHLLVERFGPWRFYLALLVEGARLHMVVRGWSLWRLPLPRCLAPSGDTYESLVDDRFHFHVEIRHPLLGLIVGYRGWLEIREWCRRVIG